MSKFSTFPSHLLIRYSFNVYWPRPKVRILSLRPKKSERCFSKASQNSGLISFDWLFLPLTKDTYNGSSSRLSTGTIRQTLKSTSHVLILKNDVIHNVHCYFVFFGIPVVILSIYRINVFSCLKNKLRYQIDHIHQIIVQSLGKATNNTVIWTKIIHDTRLIFSLFHDTRLIFWTFHATRLTPLRPSKYIYLLAIDLPLNSTPVSY